MGSHLFNSPPHTHTHDEPNVSSWKQHSTWSQIDLYWLWLAGNVHNTRSNSLGLSKEDYFLIGIPHRTTHQRQNPQANGEDIFLSPGVAISSLTLRRRFYLHPGMMGSRGSWGTCPTTSKWWRRGFHPRLQEHGRGSIAWRGNLIGKLSWSAQHRPAFFHDHVYHLTCGTRTYISRMVHNPSPPGHGLIINTSYSWCFLRPGRIFISLGPEDCVTVVQNQPKASLYNVAIATYLLPNLLIFFHPLTCL